MPNSEFLPFDSDSILAHPEYQELCTQQMTAFSKFSAKQANARVRLALKLRRREMDDAR